MSIHVIAEEIMFRRIPPPHVLAKARSPPSVKHLKFTPGDGVAGGREPSSPSTAPFGKPFNEGQDHGCLPLHFFGFSLLI